MRIRASLSCYKKCLSKSPKGAGAAAVYLNSKDYVTAFEAKAKVEARKQLEKENKKADREKRAAEKAKLQAKKLGSSPDGAERRKIESTAE